MKWLVILLLLTTPAFADKTLDRLLGSREHAVSADDVRALGPSAGRLLIGVASDSRATRFRRARALLALRFAPSVEARDFLRTVIAERSAALAGADVLDLAAAVTALQPYGREVLGDVMQLVTHASADVRQATATTLGALHAPEAESALRTRLYVERDAGVRAAVARALHESQ